jgi:hypothetical protein
MLNIEASPCSWPVGWPRTPEYKRSRSRYRVSFAEARNDILAALRAMRATEVVISTNIALRRDGLPYANANEPTDAAVAVYWSDFKLSDAPRTRVIACDRWLKVRENMRACGLAIRALHQLQLSGATQVVDRVFMGLTTLVADNPRRSWRDVFGYGPEWHPRLCLASIAARYKELALKRHPDTNGGSHEEIVELNQAHAEAVREYSAHDQTARV